MTQRHKAFQSTLPARGATYQLNGGKYVRLISIHAPREGSDGMTDEDDQRFLEFQSTLPARGATGV